MKEEIRADVAQTELEDLMHRYRACSTATIYDVLDSMGRPDHCVSLDIRPLSPEMAVAGPAFTVRGSREPRDGPELPRPAFENLGMFKSMTPGCVVVINAEKDANCGHWGEMMSWNAKRRGAVGAVIDGGTRDRRGILKIPDWAVFARYTSPIESRTRWRPLEFGVPIYVSGTTRSEVLVSPGDYIVGDQDGVLVIPAELTFEVLERAEEIEVKEEAARRDLAAGRDITEVHARYGRL